MRPSPPRGEAISSLPPVCGVVEILVVIAVPERPSSRRESSVTAEAVLVAPAGADVVFNVSVAGGYARGAAGSAQGWHGESIFEIFHTRVGDVGFEEK